VVPGTKGMLAPTNNAYIVSENQPIIIVGATRWPYPGGDASASQNLTSDGVVGSNSVTVANASGFTPGQFVLLDELSGATYQPVVTGFGCSGCTVLRSDRVAWNMHNPHQNGDDPQDAKSWFMRTDRPARLRRLRRSAATRSLSPRR
jgi:hypothetical protein